MRRLFLAALLAAPLALPAFAQDGPALFKVISPRDEIVVGISGATVDEIARRLVAEGQLGAWHYAVGRASDGTTEYRPLRRVAILRQDTLRIEAFDPKPLRVAPLP
jgi:hypothetical protein